MQTNKKKLFLLLGAIAIIALVIIVAASQSRKLKQAGPNTVMPSVTPPADEVAPSKGAIEMASVTPEVIKESVAIASGTSLITKDEIVITPEGAPVKLNVMPSSADAPKESAPIDVTKVTASENTIKISVSAAGFVPNTFTVKEGQLVNFVLTSTDEFTHVWLPDDMSLIATALGTAGGETRVKSWNAPKKGEYTFRCDIPGHAARGEVGKMIVE